jgi:hypothetical protein
MPFRGTPPLPFIIPAQIPVDLEEAQNLFEAFDANLNGDLDRDEVRSVLKCVGMREERLESALDTMFEDVDEMDWDLFRLWMKRIRFVDRHVGWRERIYLTLEDPSDSQLAKLWAFFMVFCIVVSVIMYMVESHPSFKYQPCKGCEPELKAAETFGGVELIIICAFSFDYVVRGITVHTARSFKFNDFDIMYYYLSFEVLYDTSRFSMRTVAAERALRSGPIEKTMKWVIRPMNVIDFFSIIPYFLTGLIAKSGVPNAMLVLRILRLCRLFRLFKLKKYSAGFEVFFKTVLQSMEAITVLLFVLGLLLVFLGSLMYLAEGGNWYNPNDDCLGEPCKDAGYPEGGYLRLDYMAQNLVETPFRSIFDSCWFVMTTITTVGYGDLSPTSGIGKAIAMVCMVLGILALAMPITVLGNNFGSQFEGNQRSELLQKLDVFSTLRKGLLKHMELLDLDTEEGQADHATAVEELQKMDTAHLMLKAEYQVSDKDHTVDVLEQSMGEMSKKVKHADQRMGALENKMDAMLEMLVMLGGDDAAAIVARDGGLEKGLGNRRAVEIGQLDCSVTGTKIFV